MLLKRKRSDSEISSQSFSMSPSPTQHMASSPYPSQFNHEITPLHLSSRTRKRVRDNRPSEHQIHENTLNLLFSAQKQHHQQQQAEPTFPQQEPTMAMSPPPQQQSSLHSFWALPARRDSSVHSTTPSAAAPCFQETNCEDCDVVLVNGDGDSMEMDIDVDMYGGVGADGFACSQCRRQGLGVTEAQNSNLVRSKAML
ncbi:hypothetical protein V499_09171 [Pseudogymnoascus sp. VKM F-103]|nr:hypothetical protein V499_09171 [Pseudogymnoascus sp. VKM F-103]